MTDKYRRFIAARDFLQLHRNDYDTAYRDYRAPVLPEFNWALDFFDVQAKGNTAPALWVVDENGKESKISFADMAQRSSQVANYLRSLGVKRGERLLLMLPNRVELWEIMLACIKLGAVIVPTTMLVSGDDCWTAWNAARSVTSWRKPPNWKICHARQRFHAHRRRRRHARLARV